jgi:hypothetical protein
VREKQEKGKIERKYVENRIQKMSIATSLPNKDRLVFSVMWHKVKIKHFPNNQSAKLPSMPLGASMAIVCQLTSTQSEGHRCQNTSSHLVIFFVSFHM